MRKRQNPNVAALLVAVEWKKRTTGQVKKGGKLGGAFQSQKVMFEFSETIK